MTSAEHKIVRYLNEAHATETGLMRQLQGQIAMTPEGSYRTALERHLQQTREHAERVQRRLGQLGEAANPFLAGLGMAESLMAQWLAVAKMPFDLVRGSGGEEMILKNAKDSAAAEALEIATYTAIEHAARAAGDEETATLAVAIRGDEERMLATIMGELPRLAEAVVRAEVHGEGSFDVASTGAAQAAQAAARATARRGAQTARGAAQATVRSGRRTAERTTTPAGAATTSAARRGKRAAEQAAKLAGATTRRATSVGRKRARGAELPAGYEALTAEEVTQRLRSFSQQDLVTVEAFERANQGRQTVLERIAALREDEPWPGYDGQNVDEIRRGLHDADLDRAKAVRQYEHRHKDRSGVIQATQNKASSG